MTCYANNEGVEGLLRDVRNELRQINSKLTPPNPPPPPPLPPPATKDFAAGMPDEFLVIWKYGGQWKFQKGNQGGWNTFRRALNGDFNFHDNIEDKSAREVFDNQKTEVWVPYKK
jgi:hypothetical protein